MIQEDKELLLKDLCARLPYGVNVLADCDKTFDQGLIGVLMRIEPYVGINDEYKGKYLLYQYGMFTPSFVDEVRPYLFPLSSMTEEQMVDLGEYLNKDSIINRQQCRSDVKCAIPYYNVLEWYNKNHFDYRGLIEKSLAIDATGLNIY